ncbi:52 kDa repressor of the inhibitor of the protein kinase-like [Aphis craccivora]|uniref:52 kDa repressor of the inhibitor of the protein kinase-like n=1 Tax=Aphis craccivora TaxID=307492 RepID=A0A6G0W714_APHCR|nr:52 kDa repressor of the inhibitor of the protein kinase-like [Aphis craccivora]
MVIDKIFKHTYVLCKSLQRENIDLLEAINLAEDLTNEIQTMRQNTDAVFSVIFKNLEEKSESLDIQICIPRTCKRQINRCNIISKSTEEYFKVSIFIPFLDYFIDQINSCFIEHKLVLKGFKMLFKNELDNNNNDILQLIDFYKDSDNLSEPDIVIAEIKMWKNVLKRIEEDQKPKTVIQFLQLCDEDLFPNIYKLIKILCILPVRTCTSERSFSSLRNLKTYLKNTVSEDRLNGLAICLIFIEMKY